MQRYRDRETGTQTKGDTKREAHQEKKRERAI